MHAVSIIEEGPEIHPPFKTPVGTVGLQICFDLRCPESALSLKRLGAQIITYPSAFTVLTGRAHWELLLRARVIETQAYSKHSLQGFHILYLYPMSGFPSINTSTSYHRTYASNLFPPLFRSCTIPYDSSRVKLSVPPPPFPTYSPHPSSPNREISNLHPSVIATAQAGHHNKTRQSYGHSIIVGPLGEILAELGGEFDGPQVAVATLDTSYVEKIRREVRLRRWTDVYAEL